MKMSGADFRAFLSSKDPAYWPEGLYVEEELLRVNGVERDLGPAEEYRDDDVVVIVGGALAWDDIQKDRENPPGSLISLARRWLKEQNETRVVISVPKDRIDDPAVILKQIGAKVCK